MQVEKSFWHAPRGKSIVRAQLAANVLCGKSRIRLYLRQLPRREIDENSYHFPIMAEYSKHQQNIIKRYYENYDQIQLQKLQEQLTELYLSEGKAREKRWKTITAALEKLKIPASRIEHVRKSDNPQLLAKLIEELLAKS
jgi:hypothetical protein